MRSLCLGLVVAVAGCGGGGGSADGVVLASSPIGQALASSDGALVYLFDNDPAGQSVCTDDCADDWPPFVTTQTIDQLEIGAGITGTLSLYARPDGHQQVLINGYALYHFSGDKNAGDLRGQGILLDWFGLTYAGQALMTKSSAPSWTGADSGKTVSLAQAGSSKVVADGLGRPLYAFAKDTATTVACVDDCAAVWPPYTTTGAATATADLDASKLGAVARPEGGMQVSYGGKPLYYFAGDWAPGDLRGQGVGGKWFPVGVDGATIK